MYSVHEALAYCEQENPQKYGRAKLFIICDCLQIIVTHQDVPLPKLVKSLDDFPRKWRRFEEHCSELHFSRTFALTCSPRSDGLVGDQDRLRKCVVLMEAKRSGKNVKNYASRVVQGRDEEKTNAGE